MDNISCSNVTNITKTLTESAVPVDEVCFIISIIINGIACPLTVLFNVLVIMAVKKRPELQSYTNILLACLAATDVLTGLIVQPSFILWRLSQVLGINHDEMTTVSQHFHTASLRAVCVCSCLHLMLVTCERLVAIKFTMHYPYIVTTRNITLAVIIFWIFSISCEGLRLLLTKAKMALNLVVALVLFACVLFVVFSYAILYRETLRHHKKIRTQQLLQEEVERFVKESKALKTTVFVVAAVMLCFLPTAFTILSFVSNLAAGRLKTSCVSPWVRTFATLNSLLNPLIYCWRQQGMRQFVFRTLSTSVGPTVWSRDATQ